jgi:hypothetical protein
VLGAARLAPAQQQGQLYISALDQKGEPITDLDVDDIQVMVDDAACKIVRVEPVKRPMQLSLMVDNGPGLANALANLRTGLKSFVEAIPPDVSIELLTIAPQPRFLEKYTTDHVKLNNAIDRLTPDSGTGLFFDALVEAGNRVEKDKSKETTLNVFVMLATMLGRNDNAMERDFVKLQKQIVQYAITVHFLLFDTGGQGATAALGIMQTQIGTAVAKVSRGRFESFLIPSRYLTLLPELGKQIAESNLRQTHEYRVLYEYPAGKDPKTAQKFQASLSTKRVGANAMLSLDGHMPIGGTQ